MKNKLSITFMALLVMALMVCCNNADDPADTQKEEDTDTRTFMVKLVYCDGKVDTVIINTYDGHAPNSGYIETHGEPYPVYRGANFAFINLCDLQVISEKNVDQEGTPVVQESK